MHTTRYAATKRHQAAWIAINYDTLLAFAFKKFVKFEQSIKMYKKKYGQFISNQCSICAKKKRIKIKKGAPNGNCFLSFLCAHTHTACTLCTLIHSSICFRQFSCHWSASVGVAWRIEIETRVPICANDKPFAESHELSKSYTRSWQIFSARICKYPS